MNDIGMMLVVFGGSCVISAAFAWAFLCLMGYLKSAANADAYYHEREKCAQMLESAEMMQWMECDENGRMDAQHGLRMAAHVIRQHLPS